jgi:hypothetical protein
MGFAGRSSVFREPRPTTVGAAYRNGLARRRSELDVAPTELCVFSDAAL